MPLSDASVRNPPLRDPSDPATTAVRRSWWPLLLGAALIAASIALWHDAALNEALFHPVNVLGPAAPALWSSLSVAGLGLAGWIYLCAFAQHAPERVARLLWILVVGGVVINLIKHGFSSPRPLLALGEGHLNVIGEPLKTHSMPSGHSAMAFAMMTLMLTELRERAGRGGTLLPPGLVPTRAARLGWIVLALGIALSRLAVGAHWPADALLGAGLGMLFAGVAPGAWPVGPLTRLFAAPLGQRLLALGLVVSALCIAATPAVLGALGMAGSKLEKQLSTGYPLAQALQWLLALVALAGAARWWRAAGSSAHRVPGGDAA